MRWAPFEIRFRPQGDLANFMTGDKAPQPAVKAFGKYNEVPTSRHSVGDNICGNCGQSD
jgi:hypothetical protein